MTKSEYYTFDIQTLYDMPMQKICDLVEGLIGLLISQDKEIELLEGVISALMDDGK